MFFKKTDYQGWTNWETWNTWLMLNNEQPTHEALNQIVRQGGTPQDIHDFAISSVIGDHNSRSLEDAQEWNAIPKDERVDPHYQDLLNRLGVDSIEELPENARNFHDLLGLGPDVEDSEPDLIDPDLVNWQEIHDATARYIWEDEAYETEDQFNDEANPYLQDFVPDTPDDIKFSRVASIHQSLHQEEIYDTWTGLRLPWVRTANVEGAGPYLRGILKQPGKKLMTEEGQELLKYLASFGEDLDPLTPWLTAQYKKGNLGFTKIDEESKTPLRKTEYGWQEPESGTIFDEYEVASWPMVLIDKTEGDYGAPVPEKQLREMAQWYNATDHPTRQGQNIQEMSWIDVVYATEQHQKALQKEAEMAKAAEQAKDAGEVVHTFDNGFTVRKLNPEDLWAEGKLLGHCIGGESYQNRLDSGDIEVYSLRDPEGLPKASWHYDSYGELEEMQGKSGAPKREYMEMIEEWGQENDMPTELDQGEMYWDLGEVGDWGTFYELYSSNADYGAWGMAAEQVNLHEDAEINWGPVNVYDIVRDLFQGSPGWIRAVSAKTDIVEPIVMSGYFDEFMEVIAEEIAEGDIDTEDPKNAQYLEILERAQYQLTDPVTGKIDATDVWSYNEETGKMHNPFEKHPDDPSYKMTPREKYEREQGDPKLFDYQPEFSTRLVDISGEEVREGLGLLEWQERNLPSVALQVGKGEQIVPWWSEEGEEGRSSDIIWQRPDTLLYRGLPRSIRDTYGIDEKSDRTFAEEKWLGPASLYLPRYPQEIQNQFLR